MLEREEKPMTRAGDSGEYLVLPSWRNMRRDLAEFLPEMSRREKVTTWFTYYWWPTRRWMPTVTLWWAYKVLRYPKPPPMALDRIAQHFGFTEGIPPCTDGPICSAHGWELSPPVTGEADA
jgi:hypothetical protein